MEFRTPNAFSTSSSRPESIFSALTASLSAHPVLAQPRAVLLIRAFGMRLKPLPQTFHHAAQLRSSALQRLAMPPRQLVQQALVLFGVRREARKCVALHQPLFALKMQSRQPDQPLHELPDSGLSRAARQRRQQFIQRIHQYTVLVVHCFNAYRTGMIPHQGCQIQSPKTLRSIPAYFGHRQFLNV
uniref:Uncharacterized protein n=1 Tax=mine drainage metagenome TaxID=410659 RepID=E6QHU3_9ZZZZ